MLTLMNVPLEQTHAPTKNIVSITKEVTSVRLAVWDSKMTVALVWTLTSVQSTTVTVVDKVIASITKEVTHAIALMVMK